jgi:hypothetical protein
VHQDFLGDRVAWPQSSARWTWAANGGALPLGVAAHGWPPEAMKRARRACRLSAADPMRVKPWLPA